MKYIDWDKIWVEFDKWMCSQGIVLDVRKWEFENSDVAKVVIQDLVEAKIIEEGIKDPNEVEAEKQIKE